jgi:hypothetical protein
MAPMTRCRAIGNLVAFGRPFINNPDLVDRLKNNRSFLPISKWICSTLLMKKDMPIILPIVLNGSISNRGVNDVTYINSYVTLPALIEPTFILWLNIF